MPSALSDRDGGWVCAVSVVEIPGTGMSASHPSSMDFRLLEKLQHLLGRSSKHCTLPRDGDRSLDQSWVLDHRSNELIAGERFVLQTELPVFLFFSPHQFSRFHIEHPKNGVQSLCARRFLQVFQDIRLDAVFTQQADRLPGLASARVVPNDDAHGDLPPFEGS